MVKISSIQNGVFVAPRTVKSNFSAQYNIKKQEQQYDTVTFSGNKKTSKKLRVGLLGAVTALGVVAGSAKAEACPPPSPSINAVSSPVASFVKNDAEKNSHKGYTAVKFDENDRILKEINNKTGNIKYYKYFDSSDLYTVQYVRPDDNICYLLKIYQASTDSLVASNKNLPLSKREKEYTGPTYDKAGYIPVIGTTHEDIIKHCPTCGEDAVVGYKEKVAGYDKELHGDKTVRWGLKKAGHNHTNESGKKAKPQHTIVHEDKTMYCPVCDEDIVVGYWTDEYFPEDDLLIGGEMYLEPEHEHLHPAPLIEDITEACPECSEEFVVGNRTYEWRYKLGGHGAGEYELVYEERVPLEEVHLDERYESYESDGILE